MKKALYLNVRVSEFQVATPPAILRSHGLGSCVGVVIYDPHKKIGGLAHVLLPSSKKMNPGRAAIKNPNKFVDVAIEKMKEELVRQGCDPANLVAKIAGGANMFSRKYNANQDKSLKPGIGKRNVQATKKKLKELGIKLLAEDVGGENGRTLEFDIERGSLLVSTSRGDSLTI